MRKISLFTIMMMLMVAVSTWAQSNSYNMVIEMVNGTKINIGPNDVKNIYFNDGQLVISGETIEQIAQANSDKMKWVEGRLETLSNDYARLKEKVDNIPQGSGSGGGGANSEQIAEINSKIESLQTQIQSLAASISPIPSLDGYLKTADLPDAVRNLLRDYYTKAEIDALLKSLKNNLVIKSTVYCILSPTSITPKVIVNTFGVISNTFGLISFFPKQIMSTQKS